MSANPARRQAFGLAVLTGLLALPVYGLYLATPSAEQQIPYVDKFVHMAMFATPAAVAAAFRFRWAIAVLVVHAIVSEPLQGALTTTRNVDFWDMVADLLGIVVGVAAVRQWRTDRPRVGSEVGR
ncbi:MAG: hypothetical protein WA962_08800 [Ornithinimicrobium sp.]